MTVSCKNGPSEETENEIKQQQKRIFSAGYFRKRVSVHQAKPSKQAHYLSHVDATGASCFFFCARMRDICGMATKRDVILLCVWRENIM